MTSTEHWNDLKINNHLSSEVTNSQNTSFENPSIEIAEMTAPVQNDKKDIVLVEETSNVETITKKKFPCDQCDYQTNNSWHIKTHKQAQHEGIMYTCDQCERQFSTKQKMKQHEKRQHDGQKYNCDECSSGFTRPSALSQHKAIIHKYKCF